MEPDYTPDDSHFNLLWPYSHLPVQANIQMIKTSENQHKHLFSLGKALYNYWKRGLAQLWTQPVCMQSVLNNKDFEWVFSFLYQNNVFFVLKA